jgi:hypothetical protein
MRSPREPSPSKRARGPCQYARLTDEAADRAVLDREPRQTLATSSLAYFITTFAVFQNADAESLARWVAATAPTGRLSRVEAEFAGTGPTITVQWSGLAIVSVVVLAFSPDLLRQSLVIGLSAAVVTTSWLVTIAS